MQAKNEKNGTQRADPKSRPSGGPKNGSGLLFLNSRGAHFADQKRARWDAQKRGSGAVLSFGVLRPELWL
jgi:hypothetical protein